jgi:hypothetical protein
MSSFLAAVSQRPFLRDDQIRGFVRQKKSELYRALFSRPDGTESTIPLNDMRAMLTLITEKQQRWLLVDGFLAYLVLDDRQWESPQLQWHGKLESALPVNTDESASEDEGHLTFGNMPRKWRYSRKLFVPATAEEALTKFLSGNRG